MQPKKSKVYKQEFIDADGCDWQFGSDSYICTTVDAVVENRIKLKQTRQNVEQRIFDQKMKDYSVSLQAMLAKERLLPDLEEGGLTEE